MTSMPKIIELSVELEIQRVSCPGVWLCQDGRVSLTVFALGTSYQTCLLPPMFPLLFKDVFYFRKRFQETCALNNMCCLLKEETIFCELVQWCEDCNSGECTILAQYLGALTDVLFPPNMCSTEGVDLLMRRAKDFPGILSPKIEIATKVRIDEVWNTGCHISQLKTTPCHCAADADALRQRQVCHTPQYHRLAEADRLSNQRSVCHSPDYHRLLLSKCTAAGRRPRSRSRSRSGGSLSCLSMRDTDPGNCKCPNPPTSACARPPARPRSASRARPCPTYNVYTATACGQADVWSSRDEVEIDDEELWEIPPSGHAFPPPPVSSSPPRTARRDRITEYQEVCKRRELIRRTDENDKRDQSGSRIRIRERSSPIQESSRPLRKRSLTIQECITLQSRSSSQRVRSPKLQDRSNPLQNRSAIARESSPEGRSSARQERSSARQERSSTLQERSSTLQERSSTLQERSSPRKECSLQIHERSSPQGHNSRVHERNTTRTRILPKRGRSASKSKTRQFSVYNVDTGKEPVWPRRLSREDYDKIRLSLEKHHSPIDDHIYQKLQLESRYIEDSSDRRKIDTYKRTDKPKLKPCICEICKRYHELFHNDTEYSKSH